MAKHASKRAGQHYASGRISTITPLATGDDVVLPSLGESLLAADLGLLYFAGSLHRGWLTPLMLALTQLGNPGPLILLLSLVALVFLLWGRAREAGVLLLVSLAAFFLMVTLKGWVQRERPDVAWRLIELPGDSSFPSGHALCGLTFYGLVGVMLARGCPGWLRRGLGVVGWMVGLGIGVSRVYLGVHYPLDVLGGWLAGAALVLIGQVLSEPSARGKSGPLPD
jgi:undecaprenyl-diphosphatase